jgi:hypothetical protein
VKTLSFRKEHDWETMKPELREFYWKTMKEIVNKYKEIRINNARIKKEKEAEEKPIIEIKKPNIPINKPKPKPITIKKAVAKPVIITKAKCEPIIIIKPKEAQSNPISVKQLFRRKKLL